MKKLIAALLLLVMAFSMAACMGPKEVAYVTTAPTETAEETMIPTAVMETVDFSYEGLKNCIFYFSSGAGAWQTKLRIASDGSFAGSWEDSNMGESGEGYTSTHYRCNFTGRFGQPAYVNEYTLRLPIAELKPETSSEQIEGDIRYCYGGEPYGLEQTDAVLLYLPGAPLAELPEEYLRWVNLYGALETELPFYGLYNEPRQNGFSSFDQVESFREGIAAAEEWEASLEDAQTQADMNTAAYDRYVTWDGLLNGIWAVLMDRMAGEEKQALIDEELAWIEAKEAAVAEAGRDVEGGTLYPAVTNATAANWTRDRVYVLMELLENLP